MQQDDQGWQQRHNGFEKPFQNQNLSFQDFYQNNYSIEESEQETRNNLNLKRIHTAKNKLKYSASNSHILGLFSMTAAAELQSNSPDETTVPEWLWIMYTVNTTLLILVHASTLVISTFIRPTIETIVSNKIKKNFGDAHVHIRLRKIIEVAWLFSNFFGLFLFLIELGLLVWVKFWDFSITSAIAASALLVPIIIAFLVFAAHAYKTQIKHRIQATIEDVDELENIKNELDKY